MTDRMQASSERTGDHDVIQDPGAMIDKEIQNIFNTLHIRTEVPAAGAEIDRRLDELTDSVNDLKTFQGKTDDDIIHDAETKDDVDENHEKWDDDEEDDIIALEPGWSQATEYDIADGELTEEDAAAVLSGSSGPEITVDRVMPSIPDVPKSEREQVDEAVREAIRSTQDTLEGAVEHGQKKLDEALEKGQEYLIDTIQEALDLWKEAVRPPSGGSGGEATSD